jgi:hypothetical protein
MTTTKPTLYEITKIKQAISECDRYIAKESPRREDLRPQEIKELLAFYISHRAKLQAMIA